jgi:Ca2+-binding RTX toxin-like protein
MVGEGESNSGTAALTRFYEGMSQLEAMGRRIEEAAAAVAPLPELLGASVISDGLSELVNISAAIRERTSALRKPPAIVFADGNSATAPTFAASGAFRYFVTLDGQPPVSLLVSPPVSPGVDNWVASLNASLTGTSLQSKLKWSKATAQESTGENHLPLKLAVTPTTNVSRLQISTAAVLATSNAMAFGQPNADVQLTVEQLRIRTDRGTGATTDPPIEFPDYTLTIPRNAGASDPLKTNDNVTIQDLADDINRALARVDVQYPSAFTGANPDDAEGALTGNRSLATFLHAMVVDVSGQERLAIVGKTGSVQSFRLGGASINQLGFVPGANVSDLGPMYSTLFVNGQTALSGIDQATLQLVQGDANQVKSAIEGILAGFGLPSGSFEVIGPDANPERVTFSLFPPSDNVINQSSEVSLDFNRSLTGQGSLSVLGKMELAGSARANVSADITSNLKFGINLRGDDGSPITSQTPVSSLNGGKGLQSSVGIAGAVAITNPVLTSSARFTLTIHSVSTSVPPNFSVTVNKNATNDNTAIEDLIEDINSSLKAQGLDGVVEARLLGGKLHLRALDRGVRYIELRTNSISTSTALGLAAAPVPAGVTLRSTDRPIPAQLPTDLNRVAYPDLVVQLGPADSATNFHVNLDQVNTVSDVIHQINIQTPSSFVASLSGGQIVLQAGVPFRVVSSVVGNQPAAGGRIINGFRSGAGEALGLIGSSQVSGTQHELRSVVPDRLDLVERVYIDTTGAGSSLNLGLNLDVSTLELGIATGFASLHAGLTEPLGFGFDLGLVLKDPGLGAANDDQITLQELIHANPADLFASINNSNLTASGKLAIRGSLFDEGGTAGQYSGNLVTLKLGTNNGNLDLSVDTSPGLSNLSELLRQLQNLSPEQVVTSILSVLESLSSEQSVFGKAIRTELPLMGTSLGKAADFIDRLDEAVQELVSKVDTELVLQGLNEVESALVNMPLASIATSRARSAVNDARQQLHRVREASASEPKSKVSRLIATVSMLDREIRALPGMSGMTGSSGGQGGTPEGEPLNEIAGQLAQKFQSLLSLLPTVNSLASRLADAVRSQLPDLNSVQFKFDIIPDFNGPAEGSNLAVVVGLTINEQLTKSVQPGTSSTSFGPVRISLQGGLDLDLGAEITLGLAIEIPSDLNQTPSTHILINPHATNTNVVPTGMRLAAHAVTNPALTAQIGFGSLSLAEGSFHLQLANTGASPPEASLEVKLLGETHPNFNPFLGSLPLSAVPANISATALGSLNGNVSVTMLGQSVNDAVTLAVPLSTLLSSNPSLDLQVNEAALAALVSDFDFDLQTIIAGINLFLEQLESILKDRLADLPFVGGGLEDLGGLISGLRDNLVIKVQDTLKELQIVDLASAKAELRNAIFTVLNDNSLVKLRNYPGMSSEITADDIGVVLERDQFEIRAYVGLDEAALSEVFDFSTNFQSLPFSAEGGVKLTLRAEAFVGVGISRSQGFYLLSKDALLDPDPLIDHPNISPDAEFAFQVMADLSSSSQLEIDLFLLKMQAIDNGSMLNAVIGVNLGDTATISLEQLGQQPPTFAGGGNVDLRLDLSVTLAGLPKVTADLVADWNFSFNSIGVQASDPTFGLYNLSLDMGHFLRQFIGGAATKVRQVIDPIRPVIALLEAEVPGISELSKMVSGEPITLLDLALLELPSEDASKARRFLNFVQALNHLESRLPETGLIVFGDVQFNGQQLLNPGWNLLAGDDDFTLDDTNSSRDSTVDRLITELGRETDEDPRTATQESAPADGLGIKFPIIEQPTKLIQLLLGQTVEFVTWNIPQVKLDFGWSQSFPVILTPPISVEVGLNAGFELNLGVGFDSRGLSTGNILDGFYINDLSSGGDDIDEIIFSLGVSAAALLDVGVASAGIEGEIVGKVKGNWRDPDGNGKLYGDELIQLASQGFDCVLELSTELRAKLQLVWEVLFWDGTVEIADREILPAYSNKFSCPVKVPAHVSNGNPADDRGQSNVLPDAIAEWYGNGAPGGIAPAGTLILHTGHFAGLRDRGISTDTSEEFLLTRLAPGVVRVTGMGMDATYGGVTAVVFDGGLGNDILKLKFGENGDEQSYRNFDIPIVAFGGQGEDVLYGGNSADTFFGGPGLDHVYAGPGVDYIEGGDGDDVLDGDDGNDVIFGGEGGDEIYGGEGGDDLDGGPGQDEIYGGPGNDNIWGRGGDDKLYGGDNADTMDGGDGHDRLDGGTGNDWLHGGLGNDLLIGGGSNDAQGDILLGGWGKDVIIAHTMGTPIGGTLGVTVEGGPDNDFICGSGGPDILYGGTSDDGFDGLLPNFPPVPFSDGIYPVMTGGYTLEQCTDDEVLELQPPIAGSALFRVFRDRNQDGRKNTTDFYDNGRLIRVTDSDGKLIGEYPTADIDLNSDGSIDSDSERGVVQVPDLPPGTYFASLVIPSDDSMTITAPNLGPSIVPRLKVTISDGQNVDGGEFGLYRKSTIQGIVWRDSDGDGVLDSNEQRFSNRRVYIDVSPFDGNGNWDAPNGDDFEPSTLTGPDGSYTLATDLEPGQYTVRLADPFHQTFPGESVPYPQQTFTNSPIGPEWQPSPGLRTVSPTGQAFHGQFGNTTTRLVLSDLPDHEELELSFRLYIMGPWTGSGLSGTGEDDRFRLRVVGGVTLLEATFSNVPSFTLDGIVTPVLQSFPTTGSTGRTGATTISLGYGANNDSVYRFDDSAGNHSSIKFAHFGPNLELEFRGINLESGETWGIDFVKLTARKGGQIVSLDHEVDVTGVNFAINPPGGQNAPATGGSDKKEGWTFDDRSNGPLKAEKFDPAWPDRFSGDGPLSTPPAGHGIVGGIRYNDELTNNGTLDSSDPRIANQVVYVDLNGNAVWDAGEPRRKTNTRGEYDFTLAAGTYTIREILPEGWEETTPAARPFAISQNGKLTEVDPITGAIVHTRNISSPVTISQWTGIAYLIQEGKLLAVGNPSSGNTYLFEVDPITAEAVVRTRLTQRLSEGDIAVEPSTGRLLAVTSRTGSGSWLVEIDKQSGSIVDLGNFQTEFEGGATDPSAMAFRTNGWLYVIDRNYNRLYRLDPVTGAVLSSPSLSPVDSDNIGRVAGMVWYPTSSTSGTLRLVAGSPDSTFNPPDTVPSLYQITTSGVVTRLTSSAIPESLSGMTMMPGMGHIVTLIADEFDNVAPQTSLHFGNIPVKYIWDGKDTIEGHDGVDQIWGDNELNRPRTRLIGDEDVLIGGLGNDTLRGQQKDDILWGGPRTIPGTLTSDNDTLDGGEGWNKVVQQAASNQDLTNSTLTGQGTDTLVSIYTAKLTAGVLGNTLDASAFTRGSVELVGGPGADTLIGSPQNDRLEGMAGNDTLDGRAGDDLYVFDADTQLAFDTILSSTGIDTIDFSLTELGVTVNLSSFGSSSVQTVNANLSLRLWTEDAVENIVGGSGRDILTGNNLANRITGGPGDDDMSGLAGNDVFVFHEATGDITELDKVAGGNDLDTIDFSQLTPDSSLVIDFRNGGVNALSPYATESRNSVVRRRVIRLDATSTIEQAIGSEGNDTFFDGPGGQTYEGRGGDDRYVMANNNDLDHIIESAGGGTDLIEFSAFTTPLRIDLNSTSSLARRNTSSPFNIDAGTSGLPQRVTSNSDQIEQVIGGSGRDRIFGNENDNMIDGGPGGDKVEGRDGNDTYVYRNNAVSGVADEIIEESSGGTDWISFGESNPVNSAVTIDLAAGTATVGSFSVSWTGGRIENAVGGNGNDTLFGSNSSNNVLIGGPGNDTLEGRGGSNVLIGGQGDDTYRYRELFTVPFAPGFIFTPDVGFIFDPDYLIDSRGNPVLNASGHLQALNGGKDKIDLSTLSFVPFTNVNLAGLPNIPFIDHLDTRIVTGGAPIRTVRPKLVDFDGQWIPTWIEDVVGSSAADIIYGNHWRNEIDGGAGSDTIFGLEGDDVLTGGAGTNTVLGGRGNDRYHFNWAATSNDTLYEASDSVKNGVLTTDGVDTLDFSNAPPGTGAFTFSLSTFSNSTPTSSEPRTGTIIGLRDTVAGSNSQGRGFENLIGDVDQANLLTGNENSNIIIGGSQADTLLGSGSPVAAQGGRDILIGFQGADTLNGREDDDILIGGWVDFVGDGSALFNVDAELAALIAIRREWIGPGSRAARQASIQAGVGSPSLNARLKTTAPGQTVFDDGVADVHNTDTTGNNWVIEPPLGSPLEEDSDTVGHPIPEVNSIAHVGQNLYHRIDHVLGTETGRTSSGDKKQFLSSSSILNLKFPDSTQALQVPSSVGRNTRSRETDNRNPSEADDILEVLARNRLDLGIDKWFSRLAD